MSILFDVKMEEDMLIASPQEKYNHLFFYLYLLMLDVENFSLDRKEKNFEYRTSKTHQ